MQMKRNAPTTSGAALAGIAPDPHEDSSSEATSKLLGIMASPAVGPVPDDAGAVHGEGAGEGEGAGAGAGLGMSSGSGVFTDGVLNRFFEIVKPPATASEASIKLDPRNMGVLKSARGRDVDGRNGIAFL